MAYETDYTLLEQVIQMLAANKDNKFSRVIETVVNEAMKLERTQALQAEPYERTDERTGYANGFKDKTLALATGKVLLKILSSPARIFRFYPARFFRFSAKKLFEANGSDFQASLHTVGISL